MLFQITQACYALYLSLAIHNDLHPGNIFITYRSGEVHNILYVINGEKYPVSSDMCARLYDFDRSYAVREGNNKVLTLFTCDSANQCNTLSVSKDYAKILCYVLKKMRAIGLDVTPLAGTLFDTDNVNLFAHKYAEGMDESMGQHSCFLKYTDHFGKMTPISSEDFIANLYPYPTILRNLFNAMTLSDPTLTFQTSDNITDTVVCNETDFDPLSGRYIIKTTM